jgi:hypothetical protein
MAMDGVRGYVQLASGLVELSRAKAMEAAAAVLSLPGSMAGGVSGAVSSGGVPGQVQDLAEELLAAAAANRRSLLALVRAEVESALGKAVVVPVDELDRARAAVAKLSADVEDLRDQVMASPAVRSIPQPGRSALTTVSDVVSGAMSGAASSVLAHGASLTRPESARSVPVPTAAPAAASGPRPSRRAVKTAAASTTASNKAVPTKDAAPTKKAATAKKTATTTKKAATTTKAATTKKAATKTAGSAKKAATTKKATPRTATKKAASATGSNAG